MNWLAHVFLARHDDAAIAGGFAADFLRGPVPDDLPDAFAAGVRLHRAIDAFTDAHDVFRRSKARLDPALRVARGVVVDVLYDHVLARDFAAWHDEPLSTFAGRVYRALATHDASLPAELRRLWPRIAREDWLSSYADVGAVRMALRRMSERMRRPLPLASGVDDFLADADGFAADFGAFFPAVLAESRRLVN